MEKIFNKIMSNPTISSFMNYYKSSEISLSSIAVAYYFLLSLFPIVMTFANIIPYLHIDTTDVLRALHEALPPQIYNVTKNVIQSVVGTPSPGLLTVSVIAGLWAFSKAMSALQMAMNKAYEVSNHRDFIISRFIGFIVSFLIVSLISLAGLLLTFGKTIINLIYKHVKFNHEIYEGLYNMTLPLVTIVIFVAVVILYYILPNVRINKFRYVLPGSIFSTFVFVFLTKVFGDYVDYSVNQMMNFKWVGSIVTFVLMLWFIFIARVLITGAIMNASYMSRYEKSFKTRRGEIVDIITSRLK